SLRGKEMADVIFKGSGTSGRKPMNAAEATLIFENADRKLPVDAPEVHITRRVFRSGEGEYLINRQPARLKDIRDMFRGTGVGVDAYSLIEQGKVDRLLQASARDRRAIFEEAAGISRFKAKKVEAQRRLERVEQNLLRLSDIVEEVENRLKTVRNQAGKARRYREYSERLQELRTQIARVDWRRLSEKLGGIESELAGLVEQIQSNDAQAQRLEAAQLEVEASAATASEELRNCENRLAFARQQHSQHQSTIDHERTRAAELEDEARLHRKNLLAMSDRAGDTRTRLASTQAEVSAAQQALSTSAAELSRRESQLADLARENEEARRGAESRRKEYVAKLQAAASLASQVEANQSQLAAVQQSMLTLQQQLAELDASETQAAEELAAAQHREQTLAAETAAHQSELEKAQDELAENRNLHASRAEDLAQLHSRRRGVAERHDVLEEFERTLEGIGAGVKQVLARAGRSRGSGVGGRGSGVGNWEAEAPAEPVRTQYPWSLVRGVVADFLQVAVEHSAAIDAALGDAAQTVVVDGQAEQVRELLAVCGDLTGRVVLITEPAAQTPTAELSADIVEGLRVVARADKLVLCDQEHGQLISMLLATTFVVGSLDDALALRARAPAGLRFVTLAGELVDQHGAIHFGPRQSATSLVSRRSQLRAARLDLAVLDQQITDAQRETQHLKREIERHEEAVRRLIETGKMLAQQAAAQRVAVEAHSQRAGQIRQQKIAAQGSLATAGQGCQTIEGVLRQVTQEHLQAQAAAEAMQADIAKAEERLAQSDRQRQQLAEQVTAAKVEQARCQQRLESLRLRLVQFEDDQRERERAITQVRQQLAQADDRHEASELVTLAASAQIASLALQRERLAQQMAACTVRRDAALAERGKIADELTALRRRALKLRDQEHQVELSAEQVRHERRTLADRLREDYGLELAELTHEPTAEEAQVRAAVEEEIESLRRKINQIGAVNLDALDELDELEQRYGTLSGQHKDLTEAKQSLERIIHKINADSRRLFLDTLEAIRINFQALYRKAFGGGKADIVLEEGVDVLECGVEIIATPPGKPSFNNSLLSGGEKALTAVALLLAIFQFRPSPFCVLDEVDAPFDEANIGRFIEVLREFLGWTRFVIVTHSKKTMTAATTLYGVTMQESGVSKRVSVRFDDVSDDGHIRREALDRAGDESDQRGVA
ncbi:MAG: chromosome segregation protein SMC, partial [Planctomycetaceae bacterium]|nr:chromosome segregation protein SMC [Planctomycetaceae bacterium]